MTRSRVVTLLLCALVFVVAFSLRFNTLGGALGGFSNDEFGYLARARQMQAGELPFRDFNDPGWLLTDYTSAAVQWLGGYNLRSQAVLTIGMLSFGAALTFLLARRVSGSIMAALIGVFLQLVFEPRHYNYPKIVVYALGLTLAWAYADRPGVARLAAFGALIGVAFLFRHDHIVYLSVLAVLTIVLTHRGSFAVAVRETCRLGVVVAAVVAPFLIFLALNGGVVEYLRSALVYVNRDAARTDFSLPRLTLDWSKPWLTVTSAPRGEVRINVKWEEIPEAERLAREARYHLAAREPREAGTWSYLLEDASVSNIKALVSDPVVDDTHGLDRSVFRVDGQGLRLESQLDGLENATAFLYYLLLALPPVAAVMLLRLRRAAVQTRVMISDRHLVPLLALSTMLTLGFLSRGSTNIRIPDVGVTSAILIAWMIGVLAGRDAQVVLSRRPLRVAARVLMLAVLVCAALSANSISRWLQDVRDAYTTTGPGQVVTRASTVWNELAATPAAMSVDEAQPPLLRVAAYVQACTAPTDRLFVFGNYPELYYFSDRLFAGGHAWLLPGYYSDDEGESRILERLRNVRVPIVLTEAGPEYDEDYLPVFEQIDRYLDDEYVEAGNVEVGGPRPLRVLVSRRLVAARHYSPFDLPCFTPASR